MFKQFYNKSIEERLHILKNVTNLTTQDIDWLKSGKSLSLEAANTMTENTIGLYSLPFGVAPNFIINHKTFHAPMVTEEPSVIAAASLGAKIIAQNGGFYHEQNSNNVIIGEIVLHQITEPEKYKETILSHKDELLVIANNSYPSIVKRGGGAFNLTVEIKSTPDQFETFVITYLSINTLEAMGANIANTMLEHVSNAINDLTNAPVLMAILSNYNPLNTFTLTCEINPESLATNELSGEVVRDKIISAYYLATVDKFRCVTHNKGVMNGVSAVVLASGNDTRAVEASIHSFCEQNGNYQPLTKWTKNNQGNLIGEITLPLKIGFVGGGISIHPSAQLAQRLSNTTNVCELSYLIAAVGLAQNFSALRALVTTGIQKGHMALQIKSLFMAIGATSDEIDILLKQIKSNHKNINQETAKILLTQLRQHTK